MYPLGVPRQPSPERSPTLGLMLGLLVTLAVVLVAAILTFSPVEFIHPVRVKRMRPLTLTVTFVWAILAVVALADDLRPGAFVSVALAVTSIYLAGIGAFLQATREEFGA